MLFRYRLEHDLGYKHSMAVYVPNHNKFDIYMMVFVSDNDVGLKIMQRQYKWFQNAVADFFNDYSSNKHNLSVFDPKNYFDYKPYIQTTPAGHITCLPTWLQQAVITPSVADKAFDTYVVSKRQKVHSESRYHSNTLSL